VIERRQRRGGPPLEASDRSVAEASVAQVRATGATVRERSRWLNAVSVQATTRQRAALAALPGVRKVQALASGRAALPIEERAADAAAGDTDYGASLDQLTQIDLVALHQRGFVGQGIVIGVLDTGFHRVHEAFLSAEHPLQVVAEWDFLNDDPNTGIEPSDRRDQHRHGTWILGTMAAYLPGQLVGAAYQASFVLAKTEDVGSETPIEEDHYVAGLEFVEAHGADVATSSLGYIDWYLPEDLDGATAVTTLAVNVATAKGMVCLTAAGNGGNDADPATLHLVAPADAFEVLSCGAVDETGSIAGFSSDGPSADGRVKPEILARGVATKTVHSTLPTGISSVNGTSLSTPLVAGAVACLLSARGDLGVSGIREAVFATATDTVAGVAPDPLFVRGYGILQADAASFYGLSPADLDGDGAVDAVDLAALLSAWGPCGGCRADLDGDGTVSASDLAALLAAWGS
jgi:hypothetical protein